MTKRKDDNEGYDHCRAERNKRWRRQESEDKKNEIPEFSKKNEMQAAIDSLKKAGRVTAMEYARKTSKRVVTRRKKW